MKGIKFIVFCCVLLKITLSAPVSTGEVGTSKELIQKLEEQVEKLTETLKLLKRENHSQAKRQAIGCLLNGNGMARRSCKDIYDDDNTTASGLYAIAPESEDEFTVYCDMTNGGGWTVIQRREDNTTDFYREWQEYVLGFGRLEGNFWLGLETIHRITQTEDHELLIIMVDHDNVTFTARYSQLKIGSSATDYQLNLGRYVRAGSNAGDSLSIHNKKKFSTSDNDNDDRVRENCAVKYHGGWWYSNCYQANLNGRYYAGNYGNYDGNDPTAVEDGIVWRSTTGFWHSLKSVSMAIRPSN